MIEIPLNSSPEQSFTSTIRGRLYSIRVILNSRLALWSISFSQNGVDIVNGVALVGGIDILKAYNIPLTNAFVVNLETNQDPEKEGLGLTSKLLLLEDSEVDVSSI